MRVIGDHVVVHTLADGDPSALAASLVSLGMQSTAVHGRVVSGLLPITAIPALEGVSGLRFARPSFGVRRAGTVTSEGDRAIVADIARATSGANGGGVKVGILSDSFNCTGGAPADVASGDLPAAVQVVQELSPCAGASDEGRAILQIVHDVAPGAALAFATIYPGQAAFANNILALRASGAQVIIDDFGYIDDERGDDDGEEA